MFSFTFTDISYSYQQYCIEIAILIGIEIMCEYVLHDQISAQLQKKTMKNYRAFHTLNLICVFLLISVAIISTSGYDIDTDDLPTPVDMFQEFKYECIYLQEKCNYVLFSESISMNARESAQVELNKV